MPCARLNRRERSRKCVRMLYTTRIVDFFFFALRRKCAAFSRVSKKVIVVERVSSGMRSGRLSSIYMYFPLCARSCNNTPRGEKLSRGGLEQTHPRATPSVEFGKKNGNSVIYAWNTLGLYCFKLCVIMNESSQYCFPRYYRLL